jgi:hypothetical protein
MAEGYGSPGPRLFEEWVSETHDKMDPSPTTEGIPLPPEPPRDSQTGGVFENPETLKGETAKGAREGYVDSPKNVWCWMQAG